jgi:hypothetical protein
MIVNSLYTKGMFDNTRSYFNKQKNFLIKRDKSVIAKFDIDFEIKEAENFIIILKYMKNNPVLQKFNISAQLQNDKYINYSFVRDSLYIYKLYKCSISNKSNFYNLWYT